MQPQNNGLNKWINKLVRGDSMPKKAEPFRNPNQPNKPAPLSGTVNNQPPLAKPAPKKGPFRPFHKHFKQRFPHSRPQQKGYFHATPKHPLRIIPLGGLEEIGKNMTVFEYGDDIVIIDMGFQFPEEDMLGIDYVIPDVSYLKDKLHKIRGVIITHGHMDHIGGIPYILEKINNPPFFGTKLTMALIQKRLEEFGLDKKARLNVITPEENLRLGVFNVEFFRVNHSIPDGVGVILSSPVGTIVHTGDFKFDFTPADKKPADFARIASLGSKNVVALLSDSTNALKPGYTISEKKIGETLEEIIKNTSGRLIIASFSSLIGRIQQIINYAVIYNRKVFVSGKSMEDNILLGKHLGYLTYPEGLVHRVKKGGRHDQKDALILTTGSQGEAVSALTRMAFDEHAQVKIKKGDTVVLSSSPISGNERAITTVVNSLCKLGAKIITSQIMDVHTSGHAQQEDLKLMLTLVRPKYLIPIHGELYMRQAHAELGKALDIPEKNILIGENGSIIEINNSQEIKILPEKAETNYIMVDGLGVGDIGAQVLAERQMMAENGVLIILLKIDSQNKQLLAPPDVISRGFVYMKESQKIIDEVAKATKEAYNDFIQRNPKAKRMDIKIFLKGKLNYTVRKRIEKTPLILPLIVAV